jgi:hypothetical protein
MTTVAYRDGILAADTCMVQGDEVVLPGRLVKICKCPDGSLVGGAGIVSDIYAFLAWCQGGKAGEKPAIHDGSSFLEILPDGSMRHHHEWGECPIEGAPYYAIGAGFREALGAMHAGATAIGAVHAAITHNAGTNGVVVFVSLGGQDGSLCGAE